METPSKRPRGRPRNEELTSQRKEEILACAARLFAQRGYRGLDVQLIADTLGVGKGTIYRYFPTKQDLFFAAVDRGMRQLTARVDEATAGLDDPAEVIRAGVRTYLRFFNEHPELTELLVQERAEFRDREKPTYFVHRDRNIGRWESLLRRMMEDGRIRRMPVERILHVFGDTLYGTMFTNYFIQRRIPPEEQAEEVIDVLFRGIMASAELETAGPQPSPSPAGGGGSQSSQRGLVTGLCLMLAAVLSLAAGCDRPSQGARLDRQVTTSAATTTISAETERVLVVRRGSLRVYTPTIGSIRARQTTRLGPQVSGRVKEVLVDVGHYVTKGQVLVRLDPAFFEIDIQQREAAVKSAKGALAAAEADLVFRQRELDRQKDLHDRGAGSTKEYDDARTAFDRALASRDEQRGKLAEAEQRLRYAKQSLAETEILAPYDGVITARLVDVGEPAPTMPPTQVLEIQEVNTLYLEFSLPQETRERVKEGTPLEFEVEGVPGGVGIATVDTVFPAIDAATRSFRCRAVISNTTRRYQPGMLAKVRVLTGEAVGALLVPRQALVSTASGWQVTVLEGEHPRQRTVSVGLMTDEAAEILEGLEEGEAVLTAEAVGL